MVDEKANEKVAERGDLMVELTAVLWEVSKAASTDEIKADQRVA